MKAGLWTVIPANDEADAEEHLEARKLRARCNGVWVFRPVGRSGG